MADVSPEAWTKEMEDARAALRRGFPDLHCLRCGAEDFLVRMWPDASLVPGVASSVDNRVLEIICQNCGFQEKHVVKLLAASDSN